MIPRLLEQLEIGRRQFTWNELCGGMIAFSTVLRWKARAKAGQALLEKAGPKKKPLPETATLRRQIQQLAHGPRRSRGTAELHQQWSAFISRRSSSRYSRKARAAAA